MSVVIQAQSFDVDSFINVEGRMYREVLNESDYVLISEIKLKSQNDPTYFYESIYSPYLSNYFVSELVHEMVIDSVCVPLIIEELAHRRRVLDELSSINYPIFHGVIKSEEAINTCISGILSAQFLRNCDFSTEENGDYEMLVASLLQFDPQRGSTENSECVNRNVELLRKMSTYFHLRQ
jgi:hypothetical protein